MMATERKIVKSLTNVNNEKSGFKGVGKSGDRKQIARATSASVSGGVRRGAAWSDGWFPDTGESLWMTTWDRPCLCSRGLHCSLPR